MSTADSTPSSGDAKQRTVRWIAITAMAILIAIAGLATLLAVRWPFSKGRITRSLDSALHGRVGMRQFYSSVFPHPGCVIEGFSLTRSERNGRTVPMATASKLVINAAYLDLFLRPNYIRRIVAEDLRVELHRASDTSRSATPGDPPPETGSPPNKKDSTARVDQIIADHASLIVFRSRGKKPLDFEIHSLVLTSVGPDEPIGYNLEMTNALPPGEISAHGRLGPWNTKDPQKTPLFGTSYFERANLDMFSAVAGSLSSRNEFAGTLGQIDVNGSADVPDFKVKRAALSVHLRVHFTARINALTGDVELQRAEASLLRTRIEARGRIERSASGARVTSMDFTVHEGWIQDVIALFAQDKPPLKGATNFHAHTITRSFGKQFLKETELRGQFEIAGGRFTNPHRQTSIDELSARAQSHKSNGKAREVTAAFHGQVLLQNGIAHFRDLSMSIPYAAAQMNGSYNLLNQKIDFHGTLQTQAAISQTTHGIKSVLLTPLDPFFKKKSAGAVVPAQMTGTYDHPQFAIVLASKKKATAKSK